MADLDYYAATTEDADEVNANIWVEDIRACARCSLHLGRFLACPGFFSSPRLGILFLGMSPGSVEDELGRPFVARAGKKLMELCDRVRLITPEIQVGFSNIVRCHTPENRAPTGIEESACRKWLDLELDFTKPRVVLLLGNVAIPLAFGNKKVGKVAGSARAMGGSVYIASYHPAAILHKKSPAIEESILKSLRLAKEVLRGK